MSEDLILHHLCPECGEQMRFSRESAGHSEEPPQPATVYCPECGFETEPHEEDLREAGYFEPPGDETWA